VGKVAAAGKEINPLPMYVNAALRDPITPGPPGSYESGGPTDDLIPIWKAAAPAIDILAPDIYISDYDKYNKVLDLYGRPDNALFIPETTSSSENARYFFAALGHGAIGFSPFGVDFTSTSRSYAPDSVSKWLEPLANSYELVGQMDRLFADLNFKGNVQAIAEDKDEPAQTLHFGNWDAQVTFGAQTFRWGKNPPAGNASPIGSALIAQLSPNEFLVTGFYGRVDFKPVASGKQRQFLQVEEGKFEEGKFVPIRIWNGDQTDLGLNFFSTPVILRVSLATY
jgi:beta-galactosidase GanA